MDVANYTTREAVKAAVDVKNSARANAQIDRLIAESSRSVDELCHRRFSPRIATLSLDWPDPDSPTSWRYWLDGDQEIAELLEVTTGGVALDLASVLLYPDSGPPYGRIEYDRSGAAGFESGATAQRSLVLRALLSGAPVVEWISGALGEDLDVSETAVDVNAATSTAVGVGSVLRIDDERMTVTERSALSTGLTLSAAMTNEMKSTAVALSGSTGAPVPGEMIVIDGERMLVTDLLGTTAYVTRAVDGTVLAAHSIGATVYAYRTLTVQRGALGTTAAVHTSGAAIRRWVPHGQVEGLTIAKTLNSLAQENSGYARVVGQGDGQREARGAGLAAKTREVYDALARKGRTGAV